MSNISGFKEKMLSGQILAGTFLKTPNYILVEVLAQSKLDFICIDAEHAPFDRAALDQCLAISRLKILKKFQLRYQKVSMLI